MVALAENRSLLGVGLYTRREASRLTGVKSQTINRWMQGYTFKYRENNLQSGPVWSRELPDIYGEPVLSFRDLIEVRFVNAFREYGVSLQFIKKIADRAATLWHTTHPFGSLKFRTDGRTIFADMLDETDDEVLIDLKDNQQAFHSIVSPYLYKGLEFSSDDQVLRWKPETGHDLVVLDPSRNFGSPIVDREGVPTATLYDAYEAEGSLLAVSRWYEVKIESVEAAVEFEQSLG